MITDAICLLISQNAIIHGFSVVNNKMQFFLSREKKFLMQKRFRQIRSFHH